MSSIDIKHPNLVLVFLISVSIFGLALSISLIFTVSTLEDGFAYRNLTIASAFCAVCILGIFAVLFPSSCSAIPQFWKKYRHDRRALNVHETTFRAHHPSCENYSTHVLNIGNLKFCATCYGLLVGAILVLFGTGLYFFGSLRIGNPSTSVLIGAAGVSLGLLQSALPKFSGGLTRFTGSIIFVVGTFLMLTSIDMASRNTSIGLFFVVLSVLWILTKITLSKRDHRQTCSNCSVKSCRYYKKRIR